MQELLTLFDRRRDSELSRRLLANLALVSQAHDSAPIRYNDSDVKLWKRLQKRSSQGQGTAVTIDRSPHVLAAFHRLSVQQICRFARGGQVVDVGAGRSAFLDVFADTAQTVAVDIHGRHVAHQVSRGHRGIISGAHDLGGIDDSSVRLLHASYSAPFWSASPEEAQQTAQEYLRVLEPNGIALVGSVAAMDLHAQYERVVAVSQTGAVTDTLPWIKGKGYFSHKMMTFTQTVLNSQIEIGGGQEGVELVATRLIGEDNEANANADEMHVPNFLMIRRAA